MALTLFARQGAAGEGNTDKLQEIQAEIAKKDKKMKKMKKEIEALKQEVKDKWKYEIVRVLIGLTLISLERYREGARSSGQLT